MAKNNNPFAMFAITTKKAVIKAMNNAEIEYRELTMDEDDNFQQSVIKGLDSDGKPELDMNKYRELRYLKVSTALINPEMSVEDLKALGKSAEPAINEILTLVSPTREDEEEGN